MTESDAPPKPTTGVPVHCEQNQCPNEQTKKSVPTTIGIASNLPATSPFPSRSDEVSNSTSTISPVAACSNQVERRRRNLVCLTESLKYHPAHCDQTRSSKRRKTADQRKSDTSTVGASASKPKKKLIFNETVKVFPIPMRDEYCHRVRSRIWSTAVEILENAARNTIEFAFEGYV